MIGGGPAGMEAALVASSRGHDVVLFEKEDRLGGNLLVSSGPTFKDDWKRFLRYMLGQMDKSRVDTRLGVEATPEIVAAESPEEIVVAVGAEPAWPDLPGADSLGVAWAGDVMAGREMAGETFVVAGAGGMGKETALHLAWAGKKVEVVELPGGSGADQTANFINVIVLEDYLEEAGVRVRSHLVLDEITTSGAIVCGQDGPVQMLTADRVVLAPPLRARAGLVAELSALAEEVHVIGDCKSPRILFNAIHEGFDAALDM